MKIKNMLLGLMLVMLCIQPVLGLGVSINDYDPKPAEAGQYLTVWFEVENEHSESVENVEVEVRPKDGIVLSPGEDPVHNVGIIEARGYTIEEFRFLVEKDAFEGQNEIEVFARTGGVEVEETLHVEVEEKDLREVRLSVGQVSSDPTRIKPDDENVKVDVTIQNLGDGDAQGLQFELGDLPNGITLADSYSGTDLIGTIKADETGVATFYLDVEKSVLPAVYDSEINVRYKFKPYDDEEDYIVEERAIPFKIDVKPVPLYEITSVEFMPEVLRAGQKDVKARITLKNVGEEEGESIRIKAYAKTEQPLNFELTSDFVAPELKPGETGQATLEFDIDDDANLQTYQLDVEIKNVVDDDVITFQEKIAIPVTLPKEDNPWRLLSIGIIALLAVLGYFGYKRFFQKKKHERKSVKKEFEGSYLDTLAAKKKAKGDKK